jgi:teichuronic acid biosynthesis glycosyltransferase TuaC
MKILIVSSGNNNGITSLIKNQSDSLRNEGVNINNYIIKGKGIRGYLRNIPKIRRAYYAGGYDLVHAHYLMSAVAASLAGRYPLVVSLMGSDIHTSAIFRIIARIFYMLRWNLTIVKTIEMKRRLGFENVTVLPNGVDVNIFRPIPVQDAREKTGFNKSRKSVVFGGDPKREEKNFDLAFRAIKCMKRNDIDLVPLTNIPFSEVPFYLNSADVLLLTSKYEGGVNIIKEAMACNVPIVSTNVGDVQWITDNVEGCYITTFNYKDVADKLKLALEFGKRTIGRERIIALGLDSGSVAKKLRNLYLTVYRESIN